MCVVGYLQVPDLLVGMIKADVVFSVMSLSKDTSETVYIAG